MVGSLSMDITLSTQCKKIETTHSSVSIINYLKWSQKKNKMSKGFAGKILYSTKEKPNQNKILEVGALALTITLLM